MTLKTPISKRSTKRRAAVPALIVGLLLGLCTGAIAQDAAPNNRSPAPADSLRSQKAAGQTKSPKGAMLRSLALPGWGQFYNGQWFKALIVIGAQSALVGYAVHYNNESRRFPEGSSAREANSDRRNGMFWLMGLTKLLSMVDAHVDAHLYDFDAGPDLALQFGAIPAQRQTVNPGPLLGVSLSASF